MGPNYFGLQAIRILGTTIIAGTAGFTSRQFTNHHHKGVMLVVDRISETGTATLDARVQYKNDVTGEWIDLEGAAFIQWADGNTEPRKMTIYPGTTGAEADALIPLDTDNDHLVNQYLPLHWRVVLTTAGTTNEVSIAGTLLP